MMEKLAFLDYGLICDALRDFLLTTQFKGTLSSLRQFLATESILKMMKNSFHLKSSFRCQDI